MVYLGITGFAILLNIVTVLENGDILYSTISVRKLADVNTGYLTSKYLVSSTKSSYTTTKVVDCRFYLTSNGTTVADYTHTAAIHIYCTPNGIVTYDTY